MNLVKITLSTYLVIINISGFVLCGIDKRRSKTKAWRVRETTLFNIALLGGSIGLFLGMKLFHHKTKHKSFTIFVPVIIITQVLIVLYLFYNGLLKI